MHTAYLTHPACVRHDMGAEHPECPERLIAIHDRLVGQGTMDYLQSYTAQPATLAQLSRAHTSLYVDEVVNAAPTTGYLRLDPDTQMNSHTLEAALCAAGAVVQATDLVLSGTVQRAFCAVRPPGHHAERSATMGFCFFNNAAVGIRHALDVHGLERVLLVDFDVHHGNGSEDILANDERVLMVSTFQTQLYPFSGENPLGKNMLNVPLPPRTGGDLLRQAVLNDWWPAVNAFKPQLIYVSAGFDAHLEDDMGNLGWRDADYAWLSHELVNMANTHCAGRLISTLEGGYAIAALARCVNQHVRILADLE
ncbi:histone deacetylase family protein [Parvibium lacunae]|uniref:Histone deacetylase family protein n=1 Tax=Parvibium lacunae TaxID=1888893 RepID=A0A368L8B4_9BURK|nr:histone deacetylase family protein [Parvibium lacunae]RCS59893.1 histone deacetylase family protein [Parvibium lacunae]